MDRKQPIGSQRSAAYRAAPTFAPQPGAQEASDNAIVPAGHRAGAASSSRLQECANRLQSLSLQRGRYSSIGRTAKCLLGRLSSPAAGASPLVLSTAQAVLDGVKVFEQGSQERPRDADALELTNRLADIAVALDVTVGANQVQLITAPLVGIAHFAEAHAYAGMRRLCSEVGFDEIYYELAGAAAPWDNFFGNRPMKVDSFLGRSMLTFVDSVIREEGAAPPGAPPSVRVAFYELYMSLAPGLAGVDDPDSRREILAASLGDTSVSPAGSEVQGARIMKCFVSVATNPEVAAVMHRYGFDLSKLATPVEGGHATKTQEQLGQALNQFKQAMNLLAQYGTTSINLLQGDVREMPRLLTTAGERTAAIQALDLFYGLLCTMTKFLRNFNSSAELPACVRDFIQYRQIWMSGQATQEQLQQLMGLQHLTLQAVRDKDVKGKDVQEEDEDVLIVDVGDVFDFLP